MKKNDPLTQTLLTLTLLCGALTAAMALVSSLIANDIALPTDGGVGLDAGTINDEITVIIDAGHGGEDGGTQSTEGMYEKDINLEIARILDTMLRANGVQTVMTRTEDILLYDRNVDYHGRKKVLDLAARKRIAEENENAIFVSIHMNSFPEEKYRGLQVFYSPNNPASETLAVQIQNTTHEYLQQQNDRKIKKATSSIYLLDRLQCPAVLVECGFLSNPEEAALLAQSDYRRELAFVLFSAVMSYISSQNA